MKLISKSGIRVFFRQEKLRVGEELYTAVEGEVRNLLERAAKRAIANRRTTALPQDL